MIRRIFLGRRESVAGEDEFWPTLMDRCMREWRDRIDEGEINRMLKNFDPENTRFFGSKSD